MIYFQVILVMTLTLSSTHGKRLGEPSTEKYAYKPANKYYPVCKEIPENKRPSRSNESIPDDGCGDYSVRFKYDGYCYPLLKQGPCPTIYQWVTLDPYTYEVIFYICFLYGDLLLLHLSKCSVTGKMLATPVWKRSSFCQVYWSLSRYAG